MSKSIIGEAFGRSKRGMVVALAALSLVSLAAISSPSPAKAEYMPFCWNVTLPGKGAGHGEWYCDSYYHNGLSPYITEVGGVGLDHSVCVFAWYSNGTTMCSGGPGQGVYNFTPEPYGLDIGEIENNAPGSNRVQAFMDGCKHEWCNGG
jgi:hypothetical protein